MKKIWFSIVLIMFLLLSATDGLLCQADTNYIIPKIYNKQIKEGGIVSSNTIYNVTKKLGPPGFWIYEIKGKEKLCALTFDDGPNPYSTSKLLEILKKAGVKATFFLIGAQTARYPDTARKIVKLGHEIGNHSFNHRMYSKMTKQEILIDIAKSQKLFKQVLGIYPRYIRPPYGSVSKEHGSLFTDYFLKGVFWSVDSQDWRLDRNADQIKNRVLEFIKPGSIILFHEQNPSTISCLAELIATLKRQGYRFVTLGDY
ncbi:polysaccharide deacetylase family protein [Thermoproteota archaeon]